ncbi:MAG: Rieske 2Fe-2S domain-containing protein [Candidatus Entotheonellia bacterium]
MGLRCPYHGWLFDGAGRCLEQPLAPPDSTFKDRVRTTAYQAQEMGGLVWAYLGPEPAPFLPRLDLCEREQELRQIVGHHRGRDPEQPHAAARYHRLPVQFSQSVQRRMAVH